MKLTYLKALRQNSAKPERGIETSTARVFISHTRCQNSAKPERGIETAHYLAGANMPPPCQNSAKPERGIETPHRRIWLHYLCVRTALSPNAGLKHKRDSHNRRRDIGQNSAKPERGIETGLASEAASASPLSEQR